MTTNTLVRTLEIDIGNIAVSLFVVAAGLIVIAASLFRLKSRDYSLLNFGLLCALYGLRWLAAIPTMQALVGFPFTFPYFHGLLTYLVAIPFCGLLVNIFGPGLYNSMRWLFYSSIAYAVLAVAYDVLSPGPLSDVGINRAVVVLWGVAGMVNLIFIKRKGDIELIVLRIVFLITLLSFTVDNIAIFKNYFSTVNMEQPSFILLMIGLGYAAIHHTFANDKKLQAIEGEIEIARKIQQSNLPRNQTFLKGIHIAARYVPLSTVAGDFYDILKVDETKVGILIADVSGHGVGAALIGSMLKIAYASQTRHLSDPAKVLTEMNRILQGKLEFSFVTACAVYIDLQNKQMIYATAGHPPPFLWRSSTHELIQLTNGSLILGPFPDVIYTNTVLDIRARDRLVLYTDGIIETCRKSGELFGNERLELFIKEITIHTAERSADLIIEGLERWSRKSGTTWIDDDLTLIIVDMIL